MTPRDNPRNWSGGLIDFGRLFGPGLCRPVTGVVNNPKNDDLLCAVWLDFDDVRILTIANGTLPLLIFGAKGYGLRQGLLMAPARCAQSAAPFAFALLMEAFGAMSLLMTILFSLFGLAALQTLVGAARR